MSKLSIILLIVLISPKIYAQSPHGNKLILDCKSCHNSIDWFVKTDQITFNHGNTKFPLIGQHVKVDCKKCHVDLIFTNAKLNCVSCHNDIHQQTVGHECERCHTALSWRVDNIAEIHQKSRFPLVEKHEKTDCYQCHKSASLLRFDPMGTRCIDCHMSQYSATTKPAHLVSQFPTDCLICHTQSDWTKSTFDHNTNTTFPLTGSHATVTCASCHTNGYAGGTPTACVSCHQTKFTATTNPNHLTAKFSTDCKTCHTTAAWAPSSYNHNTATTFPITGAHIGVSCISCHATSYVGTPATCVGCHLNDFNSTLSPNHVSAKFPTDCKLCHTESAWNTATFNHNTTTSFPLTGAHIGVACISCHSTGYNGISIECMSCHINNYNATTIPTHQAAHFSTDCKTCHTTTAWIPSSFNHNTATTFPLAGAHIRVSCISCHTTGYIGISTECASCHITQYNSTINPSHITAKYPTDCKICHTVTSWAPSTFNHNTTAFPLTGAHLSVDCISCHKTGYTGGTPATCLGCHTPAFNTVTNPNHVTAKFSTDCKSCHTTNAWKPSSFNHNTATTFPLSGAHIGVECISCHSVGYAGIPTTCVSCHQNNYTATTNPGHVAANFSTDCKICHDVNAWNPATFNHTTGTTFPLTGSHIGVSCISCHGSGYVGISTACVSCHLPEFNSTTNPSHVSAKFPNNCELCHTVTVWTTTTYNHDAQYFPIYSGNHSGQWANCATCHTNASNFAIFDCLSCHEHSKTLMDAAHKGRSGYAYNSINCLSCHPKGKN